MLLGLVLVLSACTKEDPIAPNDPMGVIGTTKGLAPTTDPKEPDPQMGTRRNSLGPLTGEGEGGDGISDDGDDLSGTERNRKKG